MKFTRIHCFWLSVGLACFLTPKFGITQPNKSVSKAVIETCQNSIFKTIPERPFRIGDSIPFRIQIQFRNFPYQKNTQLIISPEVHFEKRVVPLATMRFLAVTDERSVSEIPDQENMALLTRRGDYNFEHEVVFAYEPGVEAATLEARVTVIEGSISQELPLIRISNRGFSSFSRLLEPTLEIMDLDYEKEKLCVKETYRILYPANQFDLSYGLNQGAISNLMASLRSSKEILEIQITSSASPDGESKDNENLAFKRMESIHKLVVRELMTRAVNPMTSSEVFAQGFISSQWNEQPWDSLLHILSPKQFKGYAKLKEVLTEDDTIASKKEKLEKILRDYPALRDTYFPMLRNCTVEILSTPSDQTIVSDLEQFNKGKLPKNTSCTRLIQMALAAESMALSVRIYQKAIASFPEDYRAHFKLGMIHFQENNYAEAEQAFQQAALLNPKSAESYNNLGASQAMLRKYAAALQNFEKAEGLQRQSLPNKAYAASQMGRFQEALAWYGKDAAMNRAVCHLGLEQGLEAVRVLQEQETSTAASLYLTAVAGAHINDIALVCESLKSAIAKDIQFREAAKTEAEFNVYRTNPQFREAMKLPSGFLRSNP
jgi:tetratricopeptide (TPR) repeat protein